MEKPITERNKAVNVEASARKPYVSPQMAEYGNVATLTKGGEGSLADGGATMRMSGNP
ncbi:MAG: hypothetical protein ACRDAM_13090 [Casimicrobium sp.]